MSYIIVEGPEVKCGQCGSSSYENVRQGWIEFMRCLGCGHESEHKNTHPAEQYKSTGTLWKMSQEKRVVVF